MDRSKKSGTGLEFKMTPWAERLGYEAGIGTAGRRVMLRFLGEGVGGIVVEEPR